MLFRVNTLGGLLDILLHGGPDPPQTGEAASKLAPKSKMVKSI